MCLSTLSFIFLLWVSWIPQGLFLSGSMIPVDLTEKVYIGSMISVDPPKNTNSDIWSRESFDKVKSVDLWSHRIPDPDPWVQILGSIFGIHEHVCIWPSTGTLKCRDDNALGFAACNLRWPISSKRNVLVESLCSPKLSQILPPGGRVARWSAALVSAATQQGLRHADENGGTGTRRQRIRDFRQR